MNTLFVLNLCAWRPHRHVLTIGLKEKLTTGLYQRCQRFFSVISLGLNSFCPIPWYFTIRSKHNSGKDKMQKWQNTKKNRIQIRQNANPTKCKKTECKSDKIQKNNSQIWQKTKHKSDNIKKRQNINMTKHKCDNIQIVQKKRQNKL